MAGIAARRSRPVPLAIINLVAVNLAVMLRVMLILCLPAAAAQTPPFEEQESVREAVGPLSPCPTTAGTAWVVARTAQQICGGTPIAEALLAVRLRPTCYNPGSALAPALRG